jgi:tetratricopeptide (TPR) repeat protein
VAKFFGAKPTIFENSILEDKMRYFLSVFLVVTVFSVLWLSAAVPQTEESQIEGNLYTNIRLGFSFLFPSGWDVQQADDRDVTTVGNSTVVFKAKNSDLTLFAFSANLPDPSATTPVVSTGGEWLGLHEEAMEEQNFEVRGNIRPVLYGNFEFYRLNFRSRERRDRIHQTLVVTTLNGKVLGFGVRGESEDDIDEVLESLESVKFFDAEFNAYEAVVQSTQPEEVIQLGKKFLDLFPESDLAAFVHKRLALSYQQMNDYENLVFHGNKTIELRPDDPDIRPSLAMAFAEQGENNRAIDYAVEALRILETIDKPADTPVRQWILFRNRAVADANYAQGLAYLKKSLSTTGDSTVILNRSVGYLEKAIEADPQFDAAYFRLGYTYTRLNDADKAIESYARTAAIDGIAAQLADQQLQVLYEFLKKDPAGIPMYTQEQGVYIDGKVAEKEAQILQLEEEERLRLQQQLDQQLQPQQPEPAEQQQQQQRY